jgi:UDP-N-acetylmuramate--alanine ligase
MNIHFIGIGGIGVSALARYYLTNGVNVTGSDLVASEITESLEKEGVNIAIGEHRAENVGENVQLVVYSPAVTEDNPERNRAKEMDIKIQSYPEALGELTKKHFTIAVTGSHGKSTVTAMLGILLTEAKMDPTVIAGTNIEEFGRTNCRVGKSQFLVIEADEHFSSFLNYWPKMIVLLSLEADHLDFHKSLDNLIANFAKFISHLPQGGVLIANADDKNISKLIKQNGFKNKIHYYSLRDKEAERIEKIMKIPGRFNVSNALAALQAARFLHVPDEVAFEALSKYEGSWRRFDTREIAIDGKSLILIDDYGHHPTQLKVTLKAAREKYPDKKIWCLFQPHQYQRTHYLFDEFVKTLKDHPIDKLIVTDIYSVAGRETDEIKQKVSSEKLVKAASNPSVVYLPERKLENFLRENVEAGQVLIIMGAGDIYSLSLRLRK